jgi:hypothetical protein
MAEKFPGKHTLRQARGQFSSQSHEPFLRKCLYKKSDPENFGCISKKVIDWCPRKKIFNFQLSHCILTRLSPMARKKRNITGLRGQLKLTPHVQSTDVPSTNSDLPQSSDADPDPDEEEWCPNLQFDSGKPQWDALRDAFDAVLKSS